MGIFDVNLIRNYYNFDYSEPHSFLKLSNVLVVIIRLRGAADIFFLTNFALLKVKHKPDLIQIFQIPSRITLFQHAVTHIPQFNQYLIKILLLMYDIPYGLHLRCHISFISSLDKQFAFFTFFAFFPMEKLSSCKMLQKNQYKINEILLHGLSAKS